MLDRREVLLRGLDLAGSVGAEIGPLDRPLVDKADGTVLYVDYCDTEALRKRWSTDAGVTADRIHVDAVWGGNSLREALATATPGKLDYVIASHVIEHVPDLLSAWQGTLVHSRLRHGFTTEQAIGLARDAEENQTYHDVHCWVFTPQAELAGASWRQTLGMPAAASTDTH